MRKHSSLIDKYLAKEVFLERVFGPTHVPHLPNLQMSRFGVIPKKDGGWRLILDLSFPLGHSVNDGIYEEEYSFAYSKISHATSLNGKTGRGALIGKVDEVPHNSSASVGPSFTGYFLAEDLLRGLGITVWPAVSPRYF